MDTSSENNKSDMASTLAKINGNGHNNDWLYKLYMGFKYDTLLSMLAKTDKDGGCPTF